MAFVSVHDFNDENNNKYIDCLNKELCFSIEKNSKEAFLFLGAITTPAFSKKYNESNNVKFVNYKELKPFTLDMKKIYGASTNKSIISSSCFFIY